MPDTVDDFMRRFAGGGTVDDVDAIRFHDRFVSTHPDDARFDNQAYHEGAAQYLGQLPDDQFHDAARNAVAQAPPQERAGLLDGLLSALGGAAGARLRHGRRTGRGGRTRRDRQHARPRFNRSKQDERRRCRPGDELRPERASGSHAADRRRKTMACESDGKSGGHGRSDDWLRPSF